MITYVLDTNVVCEFYRPKGTYEKIEEFNHSQNLIAEISKQKLDKKAILFVPAFCIAEVKNTFAKWHYRKQVINETEYKKCCETFSKHITGREFFYSYDLNRYHNINCDDIVVLEHTTDTEYSITKLPPRTAKEEDIEAALKKINPKDSIRKHYLSSFDILIIAAGMELKRIMGDAVYLLSNDMRLNMIAKLKPDLFPKAFYWNSTHIRSIQALTPQKITW